MKEGLKIMNDLIYRKVKKEDYNQLEDIINQVFDLHHYVEHPKVLKAFLKYYLKSCMSEQTFSCVAERDGEVIGVIFGKAKNDYRIITHLPYIMSTIYYSILMQIYCIIFSERNKEYRKLHRIYSEFMKNRKNKFDGVLTLFAVKKSCRGLGTGKKLLLCLRDYLKKNKVKRIYLYTDTTCNYGFYDHYGFNCLDKKNLTVTYEHNPMIMTVFLYEYKLKSK